MDMTEKTDKASRAKISIWSGYRLTSDLFRGNPEFVGSDGVVQVIAPNTWRGNGLDQLDKRPKWAAGLTLNEV